MIRHRVIELSPIVAPSAEPNWRHYPISLHAAVLISLGVFLVKKNLRVGKHLETQTKML